MLDSGKKVLIGIQASFRCEPKILSSVGPVMVQRRCTDGSKEPMSKPPRKNIVLVERRPSWTTFQGSFRCQWRGLVPLPMYELYASLRASLSRERTSLVDGLDCLSSQNEDLCCVGAAGDFVTKNRRPGCPAPVLPLFFHVRDVSPRLI